MRIGILTGGGDAPGLNGVIRAVVRTAHMKFGWEVIGIFDGFEGLLGKTNTKKLAPWNTRGILSRGGTILGTTSRGNPFAFKITERGKQVEKDLSGTAIKNMKKLGIEALIVIGGDGSLNIAHRLAQKGVKVIGVPKTIDNDLRATHITFGFRTAVETATDALDKLHTTAESHHRVIVVEVMGRYAGWIALEAGMAGSADVILIPEIPYDIARVSGKIIERKKACCSSSIVVVSEGARPVGGEMAVLEKDASGYALRFAGIGNTVGEAIRRQTGMDVRVTVLGHVQRGGSPCAYDRILSTRYGVKAVELIAEGKFGHMVSYKPPAVTSVPLEKAIEKLKLVDPDGEVVKAAESIGINFGR
ncbi:MAG: ATP-dependent 6-phosphofructokinase [Nitrospirota bacterium]|nr:ATP-dependent 6-phosphofructokinase [Nitrospirota bacterium]